MAESRGSSVRHLYSRNRRTLRVLSIIIAFLYYIEADRSSASLIINNIFTFTCRHFCFGLKTLSNITPTH